MDLSIGDVSQRSGLSIETIRYYEREGLIPKPPRTISGRRSYGPADLETLSFIRRARDMEFSLQDVRALLAFRNGGTRDGVTAIATRHLEHVRAKLRQFSELEALLAKAVNGCRDDNGASCSILQALEGKCSDSR